MILSLSWHRFCLYIYTHTCLSLDCSSMHEHESPRRAPVACLHAVVAGDLFLRHDTAAVTFHGCAATSKSAPPQFTFSFSANGNRSLCVLIITYARAFEWLLLLAVATQYGLVLSFAVQELATTNCACMYSRKQRQQQPK